MKKIPFLTILAATSAISFISAQTEISTTPIGIVNETLKSNRFNVVGLTLHGTPIATGAFDTVSGTTLTDSSLNFTPTVGRFYVLEITSGVLVGAIQELSDSDISVTNVTTHDDLDAAGLTAGDSYLIRLAPTLEEIFGTTSLTSGGILYAALSSNTADNIWMANPSGGFDKYFLHSGTGQFRASGTTTATPNVPVIYADAIFIEKRNVNSVDSELTLSGTLKLNPTKSVISLGFNAISVVSPEGLTLRTANLESAMYSSLNPSTADNLWIPKQDGTYEKYFRRSGNWRLVSDPSVDLPANVDPVLPSAIIIERRSAGAGNTTLDLQVPVTYNDF